MRLTDSVIGPSIPTGVFCRNVATGFINQAPDTANLYLVTISKTDKISRQENDRLRVANTCGHRGGTEARHQVGRTFGQVELGTSLRGANEGLGNAPALFTTLTAALMGSAE